MLPTKSTRCLDIQSSLALIDCNNFYVSCERVFNPKLLGKPVVVLSNNDGCIVSRSQEVKDLGVKMGAPWHQIRHLADREGIIALSSNYELYADMSNRVMSILSEFSPQQEVYSIDECFLNFTDLKKNNQNITEDYLTEYGKTIRTIIKQQTGILVCIGIAPTKTLAKLANHIAKKQPLFSGVCNFNAFDQQKSEELLSELDVGEVWGVGRKLNARLKLLGINNVLDLKNASSAAIKKNFSVVLARTVEELNGKSYLFLQDISAKKKQILCSRSFGKKVSRLQDLEESIITHTERAAVKLRSQGSYAGGIYVFIKTNRFNIQDPQYNNGITITFDDYTNDTLKIVAAAVSALRQIYRKSYSYSKTGVMLLNIVDHRHPGFFENKKELEQRSRLMETIDNINNKLGMGTIFLLGSGIERTWRMKRGSVSPRYTTKVDEVVKVILRNSK